MAVGGSDQTVSEGSTVTLDGSGSNDPEGEALIYTWTQIVGPVVDLDVSDPAHPTFVAPVVTVQGEVLSFELTVNDGTLTSAPDRVDIIVTNVNHPPVAEAGATLEVAEASLVELAGSASDLDGDLLTYSWTQVTGTTVTLSDANTLSPSFSSPELIAGAETLTFELTVSDGIVSVTDRVEVVVKNVNHAPLANAGEDSACPEGTLTSLNGSRSSDPDGDSLIYSWEQVSGTTVTLDLTEPARPTFTALGVAAGGETLTFKLAVFDGEFWSEPDFVNVSVTNVNHPPVSKVALMTPVKEGVTVTLDGSQSYDPDGESLTYLWSQPACPCVPLSDPSIQAPSFIAPQVNSGTTTLVFQLTVGDGIDSSSAQVELVVENVNHPPSANAGADQTKAEGALVTLNGSGSTDPDGDKLYYFWRQIGGSEVELSSSSVSNPSFTGPSDLPTGAVALVFELIVFDAELFSVPDTVTMTIQAQNDPPLCQAAVAKPASLWPPNHKLVPIEITGVSDPNSDRVTLWVTGVTQDETVNGLGDGDTSPDAVIQNGKVLVRAERAGGGNGRVYHLNFMAEDQFGQACTGVVTVCVPHDQRRTAVCVDGGESYESLHP